MLNLSSLRSSKLVEAMRCKSADFIGARSTTGCIKAGYTAATHPVRLHTRKLAQTGDVHIQTIGGNSPPATPRQRCQLKPIGLLETRGCSGQPWSSLMSGTIHLRLATNQDADVLLQWRNDSETRRSSHSTTEVQMDEHRTWLTSTLANPLRRLYIADENGVPVGSVRADFSDGAWVLSWTVAPTARGRGVAKQIVDVLSKQISEPLRAEIKAGNIASARIAEHAGLKFERESSGILHYKRDALAYKSDRVSCP